MIIPDINEEFKVPTAQTPEIIELDYNFETEIAPEEKKTSKKEEIIEEVVNLIEPEMEKITAEAQVPIHIRTDDGQSGSRSFAFSAFILTALALLLL